MSVSKTSEYKHLFGPVPSRRFGRSLGIDLVPMKTCTLDCVFCQLGPTPATTTQRREYVPTEEVLDELQRWLTTDGQADFMTLSGSGEPTLHTRFGEVLAFIKKHSDLPRLLLTNGTLLHLPEVRAGASHADIVKMSLSAWDQASFLRVNRADPDVSFDQLVAGEVAFRTEFSGRIWLEVFVLEGLNSTPEAIAKIARIAARIAPDKVQLNTIARPPADHSVMAPPREHLEELARLFSPPAEIIAAYSGKAAREGGVTAEHVLATLRRRPCTLPQLAEVFDIHPNEVAKHLGALLERAAIRREETRGETFYVAR